MVLPSPSHLRHPAGFPGTPSQTNFLHLNPSLGLCFWGNLSKGRNPGHAVVGPALSLPGWVSSMTGITCHVHLFVPPAKKWKGVGLWGAPAWGPKHARSSGIGEMGAIPAEEAVGSSSLACVRCAEPFPGLRHQWVGEGQGGCCLQDPWVTFVLLLLEKCVSSLAFGIAADTEPVAHPSSRV